MSRPGGMAVRGVPRKPTMVGGFALDMGAFPEKPSGRTGSAGELLKPEMADAEYEAHRLHVELQRALIDIGEELHSERHVVADERIKAAMMRLDDMRKYVSVLVRQHLVPFTCSRCKTAKTHDAKGDGMCDACIQMAYGRTAVR